MIGRWRHRRTGGLYLVILRARLQIADERHDMREVVVYVGWTGFWARPADEFAERFERDPVLGVTPFDVGW